MSDDKGKEALFKIIDILKELDPSMRDRIVNTIVIFFRINVNRRDK